MITHEEYEQLKAFARIDGAVLGGLWILSFACFIGEFFEPMLGLAATAIGVGSLVFVGLRLRHFRDDIRNGTLSFGCGLLFSMYVFFYASLLMAAAQFAYFQFIDHGFLLEQYSQMVSTQEFQALLKTSGLRNDDMKFAIENLGALRPVDIALQFFTLNLFLGLFISLPMAAMMMRKPRRNFKNK